MSQTLVKIRSSQLRRRQTQDAAPPSQASAVSSAAGPKPNKADFIRSLNHLTPAEVVHEAKKHSIHLTPNHVHVVRSRDFRAPGGVPRKRGRPRKTEVALAPAPKTRALLSPPKSVARKVVAPKSLTQKLVTARGTAPSKLSPRERDLAAILLDVGLDRAESLLQQLRKSLGR